MHITLSRKNWKYIGERRLPSTGMLAVRTIFMPFTYLQEYRKVKTKNRHIRCLVVTIFYFIEPFLPWLVTNTFKCAPRDTCHRSHFSIKFSFYAMHKSYQCFCYNSWELILQNASGLQIKCQEIWRNGGRGRNFLTRNMKKIQPVLQTYLYCLRTGDQLLC